MSNPYCEALKIDVPRLEALRERRRVSTFALLIVALLERGAPMTLLEVARRCEQAGFGMVPELLMALQRCRPGRPPVWRDGDLYALDPHDDELSLQVFMLGLRPPRVTRLAPTRQPPAPLPGPEQRLTVGELDDAWRGVHLYAWSRRGMVLAILDAHDRPLPPAEVVAFVEARSKVHGLTTDDKKFKRPDCPVEILADGRWAIAAGMAGVAALAAARVAVRERLAMLRRWSAPRMDPAEIEAHRRVVEQEREMHAGELAKLRRVIVHAWPASKPQAIVLLDVNTRALQTFVGAELSAMPQHLDAFDVIAALGARALVRVLGYEPGRRRLADLSPPQKTKQMNRRGRILRITPELLIQGSCGISEPFSVPAKLQGYLKAGKLDMLRRRLEADAKSLYALYQYARLHGCVRLRWGFVDEGIAAPWVHRDEPTLGALKGQALQLGLALEVVTGSAPGWTDPWARVRRCTVHKPAGSYWSYLVGDDGAPIDDADVQLARIVAVLH